MLLCSVQEGKLSICTCPYLNKCITRLRLHEDRLALEFHQQEHWSHFLVPWHRLARVETVKGTGYCQVLIMVLSHSDGIRSFMPSDYNVMTFHKTTVTAHSKLISEVIENNFYSVFIWFKYLYLPDTVFYSKVHRISY